MRQTGFTRRGVLAGMLGGSGALLLAACGQATMTSEPDADMAEKPAADSKTEADAGDGVAQCDLLHGGAGRRLPTVY